MAGVLLLAAFTAGASYSQTRSEDLEAEGRRFEGEVIEGPDWNPIGESILVAYQDRGKERTLRVHLNDDSPLYEVGDSVTVLIDRDDPNFGSIVGEDNDPPWLVWPMIAALIGGSILSIGGGWAHFRSARQQRLLTHDPWRRRSIDYAERLGPGAAWRPLVQLTEDGAGHVVAAAWAWEQKWIRSGLSTAAEVDLVGDPRHYVVIRSVGSSTLISARAPWTRWGRSRVAREFRPSRLTYVDGRANGPRQLHAETEGPSRRIRRRRQA